MLNALTPARRRALAWMILGALALLLLAGGLGTLKMEPGRIFAVPTPTQSAAPSAELGPLPGGEWILTLMRGVLAILIILLPVSLVWALFSKEGRRRLLMNIIMVALIYFLAQEVKANARVQPSPANPNAAARELRPGEVQGEPLPPLPPAPSNEVVLIASVALALAGLGLAVWLGRRMLYPAQAPALDKIASEAERGRDALAAGEGVEDAIIRTYRQMSRVVAEARDLRRPAAATPREFEDTLAMAGLPAPALATLTRLFEQVRYGGFQAGAAERQAAIDSLGAIAAACKKANAEMKKPQRHRDSSET